MWTCPNCEGEGYLCSLLIGHDICIYCMGSGLLTTAEYEEKFGDPYEEENNTHSN